MKPEHNAELHSRFPNLYADRSSSFSGGDGWFALIQDLSEKLEAMILSLPAAERPQYHATRVKQKWATLCFYMTKQTAEMAAAIHAAEVASEGVCETCGEPGEVRHSPRVRTLCDVHQAESIG